MYLIRFYFIVVRGYDFAKDDLEKGPYHIQLVNGIFTNLSTTRN